MTNEEKRNLLQVELKNLEHKEKILNNLISKNIKSLEYEEFSLLVKYHLELLKEISSIQYTLDKNT